MLSAGMWLKALRIGDHDVVASARECQSEGAADVAGSDDADRLFRWSPRGRSSTFDSFAFPNVAA